MVPSPCVLRPRLARGTTGRLVPADAGYPRRDDREVLSVDEPETSPETGPEVTRHEERAEVGTERHAAGRIRVRSEVETVPARETVSRHVERVGDPERVPAAEGDSGQVETLEDGSVSIPVFEEVLVVTKKLVVRERIIVRKQTVVEEETVETELRREHVVVEADEGVEVEDRTDRGHN
jgi:stress response protein YsnF